MTTSSRALRMAHLELRDNATTEDEYESRQTRPQAFPAARGRPVFSHSHTASKEGKSFWLVRREEIARQRGWPAPRPGSSGSESDSTGERITRTNGPNGMGIAEAFRRTEEIERSSSLQR
jgi:hypothetical protein